MGQAVVSLHADTIYPYALVQQAFDQAHGSFSFLRLPKIIVIVVKFGIRSSLVGIGESFRQIVFPDDAQPLSFSQCAIFFQRFVHHVPAVDFTAITSSHGANMVFHALEQVFSAEWFS